MSAYTAYTRQERLLTISDLTVAYGKKVIINKVNAVIDNVVRPGFNQGQVVALLGPSGVGKTQLFRCLAGLQRPTSGQILVGEKQQPTVAGDVGVVMQHYPLLGHRTVMSNLLLANKNKAKVLDLLKRFNLESLVGQYPCQLSGGQRQRIAIIQQLLCSEHFILMDEPFSGLDIIAKKAVMNIISEVAGIDEHNTIIVTTHDVESAVAIADTVWLMGRRYDAQGNSIGAEIIEQRDLIEEGLAWNPAVEDHPRFIPTVLDLKKTFRTL